MTNESDALISHASAPDLPTQADGISALLDALQAQGVTLLDRDGVLLARPLEPLTDSLRERIRRNRDALLSEVQRRPLLIRTLLADIPGSRIEL